MKTISEEHKAAISAANKGSKRSLATRLLMSQQRKGKPLTVAQRAARIGRKLTEEHKRSISIRMLGNTYAAGNMNRLGVQVSDATRRRLSESHKGLVRSRESLEKLSASLKGKQNTLGKKFTAKARRNMSAARPRGANHAWWRGGVTPKNQAIRGLLEYKLWREAVFKRDDWRCVKCGVRSAKGVAVELQADHVKPFAHFPELRFDVDNGRTLCLPCHKQTDTYGRKADLHQPKGTAL